MSRLAAALVVAALLAAAEPASGQSRSITGKVTDEEGQPVAGAAIEVTNTTGAVVGLVNEPRRTGGQVWRAITNQNGDYGVAVSVSGVYLVTASKDGVGTDQTQVIVGFESVSSVNLRLAETPAVRTDAAGCANTASNTAFEQGGTTQAGHPALGRLLRWFEAVQLHTAGCSDSSVLEVGRWSPADLETLLADLTNISAFHRWIRENLLESSADARSTIESLTDGPRRESQAKFIRDPQRVGAILLYNRRFDLEDIDKIFHGNETLRRGAVLHADIAVYVPGGFNQYPTVGDGRRQSARPGTVHWQIGRLLLDTVSPAPAGDAGALLWYGAVSAHLLGEGELAEAARHLAKARQVFPAHPRFLLDSAYLHLELSSPGVQAAVQELRAQGTGVAVDTRRGELQHAERFLRETLAVAPENVDARYRLGHTLGELGRRADAVAELRKAIEAGPDGEQRYLSELFLGRQEHALGRRDEAKRRYENAAAIFPDAQSPQLALGHLARESGDRAAALSALRTITTAPDGNRQDPWLWYYKPHLADAESLMQQMRKQLAIDSR